MKAALARTDGGPVDQLIVAIAQAPQARLDGLAAIIWKMNGAGAIDDQCAESLGQLVQARRMTFGARRRIERPARGLHEDVKLKPLIDRRAKARKNRRTWSASGALHPSLRHLFTPGEAAVAAVVRKEVKKHGSCTLSNRRIAETAGLLSVTIVKRFLRIARRHGLIEVTFRPRVGQKNETNVIRIRSKEWLDWNEYSGGVGGTEAPTILKQAYEKGRKRERGEAADLNDEAVTAARVAALMRLANAPAETTHSAGSPSITDLDRWRSGVSRRAGGWV